MFDVNAKIEELRSEYTTVTDEMKELSNRYNVLDKRKIEIEGAYKTLMEMTQEDGDVEKNDTSSESE